MGVQGDRAVWIAETAGLEIVNLTVGDLLDQQAQKQPDKEALVYDYPEIGVQLCLSFSQYRAEVDTLAKGLLALGVRKGEHVAVWAPNVPEWIYLQFALARIGAVMVTVNTAYKAAEVEYVLRQGDVTTLFLVEEFRGNPYLNSVYQVAPELHELADPLHELLQSASLPRLQHVVLIGKTERSGTLLYAQLCALGEHVSEEELRQRQASVTPQDVAMIMYTSGTTGFPKRAMLRACLKRDDSRGIEAVHLGYEKEPTVSNRFDRPSMGLYQRTDPTCKARRSSTHTRHASDHQWHVVRRCNWLPMADVAP